MPKPVGEQRRHPRVAAATKINVGWTDSNGTPRRVQGTCTDTSEGGIRVELNDELTVRSTVYVRSPALGLDHAACVRFCRRKGVKFLAGLEFTFVGHKTKDPIA
jgi:hypothetical protein